MKEILHKNRGRILLAAVFTLAALLVPLLRTPVIQQLGYPAFKTLRAVAFILAGLSILLALASVISSAVRAARERKEEEENAQRVEEYKARREKAEKNEQAKLNVREPLKDKVIYDRMKSWLNEDWGRLDNAGIPQLMSDTLRQMDDMNAYQAKLSRLITNNGADYLEDTNAVLESVEQCILRKVRKVLNCFVVYDTDRAEDVEKMRDLLRETRDSNEQQLDNVKEFLFAITDFLNRQGEDDTGIEKLNIYKKTILESTNDQE